MTGTKWMLTAWMLVPLLGCASLTDYKYEQTQRSRARSAWRDHGSNCEPNCYGKDYQKGWKDGFYDVATGGKGCPPVVAPVTYWKPSQILEDHDRARNTYYSGFQDGVACALRYPQTHYLKLWTSCECPGPMCEKQCCPTNGCMTGGCMTGGCGLASQGMMDESNAIESGVVIPSAPIMDSPVPTTPVLKKEPVEPAPESLPEPKASSVQLHKAPWTGVEPAQPLDLGVADETHSSSSNDLGFIHSFDQMIEESSSQIRRCTSKEPVE